METYHAAVQEHIFHVGVVGKVLIHILPDLMLAPAGKTLIDAVPVAIFFRQKAPLGAAAGDPEHVFDVKTASSFFPGIDPGMVLQEKEDFFPLVVS